MSSVLDKIGIYDRRSFMIAVGTFVLGMASCTAILKVPACNHATRAVAQKVDMVLADQLDERSTCSSGSNDR